LADANAAHEPQPHLLRQSGVDLSALPPVMSTDELAAVLGITPGALAQDRYRTRGGGIPYATRTVFSVALRAAQALDGVECDAVGAHGVASESRDAGWANEHRAGGDQEGDDAGRVAQDRR